LLRFLLSKKKIKKEGKTAGARPTRSVRSNRLAVYSFSYCLAAAPFSQYEHMRAAAPFFFSVFPYARATRAATSIPSPLAPSHRPTAPLAPLAFSASALPAHPVAPLDPHARARLLFFPPTPRWSTRCAARSSLSPRCPLLSLTRQAADLVPGSSTGMTEVTAGRTGWFFCFLTRVSSSPRTNRTTHTCMETINNIIIILWRKLKE
jgi:hypothetical protein